MNHSGDQNNGNTLLHHVKLDSAKLGTKELCVFVSGYQRTQITRFLGTNPALLVADHDEKVKHRPLWRDSANKPGSLHCARPSGCCDGGRRHYLLSPGHQARQRVSHLLSSAKSHYR